MKAKKGLCIVLSALLIATTFAACTKKKSSDNTVTTNTNADGEAYVNVTDANGETVTDANGNAVTSVISDNEKSSIAQAAETTAANGETTTTTTAGIVTPSISDDINITASSDDLLKDGTKVSKKTTLRDDVIAKVVNTGKFTMAMNIVSGGNKIPATITLNDKKICAEITYSGYTMRVLFMNDKMYMVLPTYKYYMELNKDDYGDMSNFTEIGSSISSNQTYVGTTKVDGYTCEEYKNDSGATLKYYFSGNEWKRMEIIDGSDMVVYEITSLKGTVDSSLFSIDGYTDASAMLNAMTSTTTKK